MNIALNLLPWRAQRRQQRWRYSLLALALSVLVGGVLWWWLDATMHDRLHAQRQRNQILARQLAALEARIEAFEHHAQQQRAQAMLHARLDRERLSFIHLLDALVRNTPASVALAEVQQQGDTLTLTARAASSAQIAHTVRQWGASTLSAISPGEQGGYDFTLSAPWSVIGQEEAGRVVQVED